MINPLTLSKNPHFCIEEYQSTGWFLITLISETLDISFEINAQDVYLQNTKIYFGYRIVASMILIRKSNFCQKQSEKASMCS